MDRGSLLPRASPPAHGARAEHGAHRRGAHASRDGRRRVLADHARRVLPHLPGRGDPDGPHRSPVRRARRLGRRPAAGGPAAQPRGGRPHRRRRWHPRLPPADLHPVLRPQPAGGHRLPRARGVRDGPRDGRRGPPRQGLRAAALRPRVRAARDHVDPRDRGSPRPARHDPGRAADVLLRAHPGLQHGHRAALPAPPPVRRADLHRRLRRRRRRRAGHGVAVQAHDPARAQPPARARAAALSRAQPALGVLPHGRPRRRVRAHRGHHHPRHLPAALGARHLSAQRRPGRSGGAARAGGGVRTGGEGRRGRAGPGPGG